jgi:hypothetical protein
MIIDLVLGLAGVIGGYLLGFGGDSWFIGAAALVLDLDLPLNELIRIFIKREKSWRLATFLDDQSFTHKYLFHLPLVVLPLVFIAGTCYRQYEFGLALAVMVFLHLWHDTVDSNFDGVAWLWPINRISYKVRWFMPEQLVTLEKYTRSELQLLATEFSSRSARQIIKDNFW